MLRSLTLVTAALTILACGGGDGTTPPAGTPGITLSAGSASATVARGASTSVTLSLGRLNSFTGAITLSAEGVPTGVTVSFTPSTVTGSTTSVTAAVSVDLTAAPAITTITIRASGSGITSQSAPFVLTVPTPAITLSAGSGSATAAQGTNTTVPISITRVNGANSAVTLTAEGLPAGVTAGFAPGPIPVTETASTMTLTVGSSAVAGTYPIVVRATASDVVAQTTTVQLTVTATVPAYTLTGSPTALTLTAGSQGTSTLTITKSGGFTGAVTLALEGAPNGVTANFAPNPATGTSSTLTIGTTAGTAAGLYNLVIRGTASGLTDRTLAVALTVTAVPSFALSAAPVTVAQGAAAASTVTITRAGGFSGIVNLTAANLPTNVTASFNPAAANGGTSALTLTAAAGATPGSYSVTVNGAGVGVSNQSTTVALTVTPASGNGAINWRFCRTQRIPLWFAFRDGQSGTWTRVTVGANNTFSFTITNTTGAVAMVQNAPVVGTVANVFLGTPDELIGYANAECAANFVGKTLSGRMTNLTTGTSGSVWLGSNGGNGLVTFAAPTFQLFDVADGTSDLLAFRTSRNASFVTTPDRGFLRRDRNYAANAVIPDIDVTGAESFAVATATISFTNFLAGDFVLATTAFMTPNGASGLFNFGVNGTTGAPIVQYGVPATHTLPGDFHIVTARAQDVNSNFQRHVVRYTRNLTDQTFSFGPVLSPPTITTSATVPYPRIKVRAAWQSDYNSSAFAGITGGIHDWIITGTRAYFGASAEYEFEIPDLSGVPGFQTIWGPPTGGLSVFTFGWGTVPPITEDATYRYASRTASYTP